MKTYVRFDEISTVGYLLNDVKFADLVPLWRYLYGLDDWAVSATLFI